MIVCGPSHKQLRPDETMFTLTKKKAENSRYPKNELRKQASGTSSEVEKYSRRSLTHTKSAQVARRAEDLKM